MTLEKQQMIDRIYEVIADKTLSFGCMVEHYGINDKNGGILTYCTKFCYIDNDGSACMLEPPKGYFEGKVNEIGGDKIIGHPVMIGDVLDWIDKQHDNKTVIEIGYNQTLRMWKGKRKPIEDQSEECISFIYYLIKDDTTN